MRRVIISVDQSHNPSLLFVESSRPFRGASNVEGDLEVRKSEWKTSERNKKKRHVCVSAAVRS